MPWAPKSLQQKWRKLHPKKRERSSHARGYTRRWSKVSADWLNRQFAAGNVYCGECGKLLGGERRDIHVDHIIDHKGDQELFWDESNLQALHVSCHSRKTCRENPPGGRR